MTPSSPKKSKRKSSKTTRTSRPHSFSRTLLVGMVMGILLFVFVTFVITALPDNLQGQRDIRITLEQIFFEIPTQPFLLLGKISGYSFSKQILFLLSALSYVFIGIFANIIWQFFRRRS